MDKLELFFKIACAISNAYFKPLLQETEEHRYYAEEILRKACMDNELQKKIEPIERREVCWELVADHSLVDFPFLTLDDLRKITLGPYQLDMAPGKIIGRIIITIKIRHS